ncbi:beta-ketoacyl synthase N-terminal-like domain-containing protein [Stigmatella hybrida]|uniref:beta-ketoacyl synthase N-terminal-like domain-containing protein n=1 Tax=Stigmatella hybrida TaxID=394097 RepID=UPI001CDB419C|nr:beta-ketoacyl synthase N-terminal-like domain-containing protein [Stigmatella hybrida]
MLYELLHRAARAAPSSTALVYGATRISYGRLLRGVEGFAAELATAGLERSDCVSLVLDNNPMFVVAFFAAAKRGCVILPLSPQLANDGLVRYFSDARPRLVVTTQSQAERCRQALTRCGLEAAVCAVSDLALPDGGASLDTSGEPSRRQYGGRALYLYTSGSEGYKKRICRTQENLHYEAMNFVRAASLGPEDTVGCLVPLYHSYGLGNGLLAAVGAGATLVLLAPRSEGGEQVELPFAARCKEALALIEREGVRVLAAVAHQYEALAQLPREPGLPSTLPALRWSLNSGNRLPLEVYQRFLERFGVPIRQLYGSTETGSIAANLVMGSSFRPDVVGACLDNVKVSIVDEQGQELPPGAVGAVLVSSPVLPPDGYDGKPEATLAAFSGGHYRTGDLGCLSPEGILRIVGRKQTFIDTGGYKVDPKNVEAVLLDHPLVREAVVLGVHAPGLGQVVKAVIVAGEGCDEVSLVRHCQGRLAAYEVPRLFDFREALPRSPLGKVLKDELLGGAGPGAGCFVLESDGSRGFESMAWRRAKPQEPGPGEIRLQILAAGLGLQDVLRGAGPGSGCCGRVIAIGEGVTCFKEGDEVITVFPGCLASHVCVPELLAVPKPRTLTVEEAAALPSPHVLAHYALVHAAGLQRGERLLIHAASDGVGLAALQAARHRGAEVFATAGSEATREHLRALGASRAMAPRSPAFADEVRQHTGGEGVDVLLNAPGGAFHPANLELLRPGGRFIELDTRDARADDTLGLRPFLRGLSFTLVDLHGMMSSRPQLVSALLREVAELAEEGVYRPRLDRTFPASEVGEALRYVEAGTHVGAIVVDLRDSELQVQPAGAPAEPAPGGVLEVLQASLPLEEQRALLEERIRGELAALLRRDSASLPRREPLRTLGMDSLSTVLLKKRLAAMCGISLPVTFIWEHPTIEELAEGVLRELRIPSREGSSTLPRDRAPRLRPSLARDEPMAIIGIGCRLPGGASSPSAFWELLSNGVDAIREVPADRWRANEVQARAGHTPGLVVPRWGGFLEGIDGFDAAFFGISSREAQGMDPQQRLLLEVSWEALEDGGLPPLSLRGSRTGVFMGMSFSDYGARALYSDDLSRITPYSSIGNVFSIAAGRISYVLGLSGPSLALDTACSSSLAAVHLACQSLRAGECDMALAGGVNLILEPNAGVALGRMNALAPDGRCKPFDASADGFVRSEGCAVVAIKPLGAALRDRDRIYALIRGSASNHDGRSNGLTAPNGRAQRAVIQQALAHARVPAAEVGYVETHGTGTPLGDPIEVHALGEVLGEGRDPARPLLLGAVKGNIGHTEACAGVTSLIKVALVFQHGTVPANLHFRKPNPHIAWEQFPVRVADTPVAWLPRGDERRIAGVSAFGFSGTNVHVLLEEPPP